MFIIACLCVWRWIRDSSTVGAVGEGECAQSKFACARVCIYLSIVTSVCMCVELQLGGLDKWLRVVHCQSIFISKPTLRHTPGKWEQGGLLANLVRERSWKLHRILNVADEKKKNLISGCNHRNTSPCARRGLSV